MISTGAVEIHPAGLLARRWLPGVCNRRQLADTTERVPALTERTPGLVVLPADDPTAAARLATS
jgi:hypothetical protein